LTRLALVFVLAVTFGMVHIPPSAQADPSAIGHCWVVENPSGPPYLDCSDLVISVEVIQPWHGECPQCGLAVQLESVIQPEILNEASRHIADGFGQWSQAANIADQTEQARLRNQALDVYTEAANLLGDAPAQVAAFGLIDQDTGQLYAVSDGPYPEPWGPLPDSWGPSPQPWQWPHLITDAVADLQIGIANPNQMPQQRALATEHLDEAYQDLITTLTTA
jgi:hypothetical protein